MDGHLDSGPLVDVLLFKDASSASSADPASSSWRAVLSVDGLPGDDAKTVDLSGATPMAPYRVAQQTGDLGFGTALTYCVQVQDRSLPLPARSTIVCDALTCATVRVPFV